MSVQVSDTVPPPKNVKSVVFKLNIKHRFHPFFENNPIFIVVQIYFAKPNIQTANLGRIHRCPRNLSRKGESSKHNCKCISTLGVLRRRRQSIACRCLFCCESTHFHNHTSVLSPKGLIEKHSTQVDFNTSMNVMWLETVSYTLRVTSSVAALLREKTEAELNDHNATRQMEMNVGKPMSHMQTIILN